MIGPSGNVRVLVATKPVDFRKGADGLAALVREAIAPIRSPVWCTCSVRNDKSVKLIFSDGAGSCSSLSDWKTASLAGRQSTMG